MDLPRFGMVLERRGGNDNGDGDGSGGGITADGLVDVTFPHLYDFMNGSDGYSSFRGLSVYVATATETRSGTTTVTASFTGEVGFKANGGGYVPSTDDMRESMAELFSGNDLMRWLDGALYNKWMRISTEYQKNKKIATHETPVTNRINIFRIEPYNNPNIEL